MRPLKNAQLKYPEVKRLGYKVSRSLWKNCSDRNERNKGKPCFNKSDSLTVKMNSIISIKVVDHLFHFIYKSLLMNF